MQQKKTGNELDRVLTRRKRDRVSYPYLIVLVLLLFAFGFFLFSTPEGVEGNLLVVDSEEEILASHINILSELEDEATVTGLAVYLEKLKENKDQKRYEVEVLMDIGPVKKIIFHDLSLDVEELKLGVDNVIEEGPLSRFDEVYAIDPTQLDFTNATVTAVATGNTLYKCKGWDFEGKRCEGGWGRFMDLVPGQEYTFTLTADDPAFGETLTILNVQSHPLVGGDWKVEFTTEGNADLFITAINETSWTNSAESGYDLKFFELKCGEEDVPYQWINGAVYVPNYNCDEKGYEKSKVLTGGKHDLMFTFGSETAYAHNFADPLIIIGETGSVNTSNFGELVVSFIFNYSSPPLVFATPITNNAGPTDNGSALIPLVHSINTTHFTVNICQDNGATTCDTTVVDETVHYFVFDVNATLPDWIAIGTQVSVPTNGADTAITFGKTFTTIPYVFTQSQTYSQSGSDIAPHAWVDDVTTLGANLLGCTHQGTANACDAATPSETIGWVAIDVANASFSSGVNFQAGNNDISNSAWTPISWTANYTSPRMMVTQNDDDGGQDPQYAWARNVSTLTPEIRYCEQDTANNCNTHTSEFVMWFSMEQGLITIGELSPQVINVLPQDQQQYKFVNISINTTITDSDGVDTVLLNITLPNGTVFFIPMVNNTPDFYEYTFHSTENAGLHSFTIIANDTIGNVNATETGSFSLIELFGFPSDNIYDGRLLSIVGGGFSTIPTTNISVFLIYQADTTNVTIVIYDGDAVGNFDSGDLTNMSFLIYADPEANFSTNTLLANASSANMTNMELFQIISQNHSAEAIGSDGSYYYRLDVVLDIPGAAQFNSFKPLTTVGGAIFFPATDFQFIGIDDDFLSAGINTTFIEEGMNFTFYMDIPLGISNATLEDNDADFFADVSSPGAPAISINYSVYYPNGSLLAVNDDVSGNYPDRESFAINTSGVPGLYRIEWTTTNALAAGGENPNNILFKIPFRLTSVIPFYTADLEISKTYHDENGGEIRPGDYVTYQILIANTGNASTNLTLVDPIPTNTSYEPTSMQLDGSSLTDLLDTDEGDFNITNPNTVTMNYTNLSIGQTINFTFRIQINPEVINNITISNQANVSFGNDSELSDDPDTIPVNDPTKFVTVRDPEPQANLFVVKTDTPDPVVNSTFLNYTINITNFGLANASNVTVIDTFANVSFVSAEPTPVAGTNNTFIFANLTPGETALINITVLVDGNIANNSNITNFVNVSYFNTTTLISRTDEENTTVTGPPFFPQPNLTITKIDSLDPILNGTFLNYTIIITNNGLGTAINVTVFENYPSNVTFSNSTPQPDDPANNNSFSLGNLSFGETTTLNITVLVNADAVSGATLTNFVNVTFENSTGALFASTQEENSTTINPELQPNITVQKSDNPDPVLNGTLLNYTINITNLGSGNATNVTVFETYPTNVSFVSSQPVPDDPANNNSFSIGNLTPGEITLINITVLVNGDLINGSILTNFVNISFENSTSLISITREENTTTSVPIDDLPPLVFDLLPRNGTEFNTSQTIEIGTNVTDDFGVDFVFANLTLPDGSSQILLLTNTLNNFYNTSFTIPQILGIYNVTFFANDTSNNVNFTETTFFNVTTEVVVIIVNSSDGVFSPVNLTLVITDETGTPVFNTTNLTFTLSLPVGIYNITQTPVNQTSFLELKIVGANITGPFSLIGIDVNATPYSKTFIPYAINPEGINFSELIVTDNATGVNLYKCLNWNYTGRECGIGCTDDLEELGLCEIDGTWVRIRDDLIEGQIYSFNLTALDPGFSEYTEEESENSTTSTIFVNKTRANFTPTQAGNHLLLVTAQLHGNSQADSVLARVLVDGVNVSDVIWEPKDNDILADHQAYGTQLVYNFDLSNHVIDLQWASENGDATFIKNARISVIKVDDITNISRNEEINLGATFTEITNISLTPASKNDYLIIGTGELRGGGCAQSAVAELRHNGAVLGNFSYECKDVTDFKPFFIHNVTNLTANQQNFTLHARRTTAGGSIRRSRISAIRLTPDFDHHFALNNTRGQVGCGGACTTPFLNQTVLTFTPPEQASYLFIATAVFNSGAGNDQTEVQLVIDGNISCNVIQERRNNPVLDRNLFVCQKNLTLDTTAHTASIRYAGQGSTPSSTIEDARITAIRIQPDDEPPKVFNLVPVNGTVFNNTATIEIAANVTDNIAVDFVFANITFPNGTSQIITLTNAPGTEIYNASFTIPGLNGLYNVTFFANDTVNNINNTESTIFEAVNPPELQPNLTVTKTSTPDPVLNGTSLSYTINISNSGPGVAINVTLFETYPLNVSFNVSQPVPDDPANNNSFSLGNLTSGESILVNITVLVNADAVEGATLTNFVNITFENTTTTFSTSTEENTTITLPEVFLQPNITLIKTDNPDPVENGTSLAYTINITNLGPGNATNVTLFEIYPVNVSFVSSQPVPDDPANNNSFSLGNLTPGESILVNITVIVNLDAVSGATLTNFANITFTNGTTQFSETDEENTTVIVFVELDQGVYLTVFCGQNIEVGEETTCAIHTRYHNGSSADNLIIYWNVTNATGQTVLSISNVLDAARFFEKGVYDFNFTMNKEGNYAVYTYIRNTDFSTSTAIYVRDLFESSSKDRLEVSGAWFQANDTILVDALFTRNDGTPISGANCTLSIKDNNLVEIVTNASMTENSIAFVPHYTYNVSNISVISSGTEEGIFFGHVRCLRTADNARIVFSEADFTVHTIQAIVDLSNISITVDNSEILDQILATQAFLQGLLDAQFEFTQEEIFLVTDSVNQITTIANLVSEGKMSPEEAQEKVEEIKQNLFTSLGTKKVKTKEETVALKATIENFEETFVKAKEKIFEWKTFFYSLIFTLVLVSIIFLIKNKRKEDYF